LVLLAGSGCAISPPDTDFDAPTAG